MVKRKQNIDKSGKIKGAKPLHYVKKLKKNQYIYSNH
jgi:hypothetical protein